MDSSSIRDFSEVTSIPLDSLIALMDQQANEGYEASNLAPTAPLIITANPMPNAENEAEENKVNTTGDLSDVILSPSYSFNRFIIKFGRFCPLLFVASSIVLLILMYACGLIWAPSFDPNWAWKLTRSDIHSESKVAVIWTIFLFSIFNGTLLLVTGFLRHDFVVGHINDLARLIDRHRVLFFQDRTFVQSKLCLAKLAKYNYLSVWALFFACCFHILAGGFYQFNNLHHLFSVLHLVAMVLYCAYRIDILKVLSYRFNIEQQPGFFCLFFVLLLLFTGLYLLCLFISIFATSENASIHMETLCSIAIDGVVSCIYWRMAN